MIRWAVWIIVVVGLAVYFNSLFNGFVWDDEEQIVNNLVVRSLANWPQIFSGATFNTGGAGLSGWFFRPLLTFTYMVNYAVWGPKPFGFHLFQVIFHLLNGVLIFKILTRLTVAIKAGHIDLINLLTALVFTVHPAISEAVVYIAALSEVMYTFLILMAIYYLLNHLEKQPTWGQVIVPSLAILAALLFKESAIVAIPLTGVVLFFLKAKFWPRWSLGLISTGVVYFAVRLFWVKTPIHHPQFAPISEASLVTRLLTIPAELIHYLRLMVFPDKLAISQHFLVTSPVSSRFLVSVIIALGVVLGVVIFTRRRRSKLATIGLVWFSLGFALISNLFPLDMTVAERWLYFPFIGVVLFLAAALKAVSGRRRLFAVVSALLLVSIGALGVRTAVRNTNWVDGLTLYSHDIAISPDSFDLENNLGVELYRQGQYAQAKEHFANSIRLQPKWHFAYNNLGAVYQHDGDWQRAKELYQKTLTLSDYYLAYENLARIYVFYESPQTAQEFIQGGLRKLPDNPKLWLLLAIADYKLGNSEAAVAEARQSYLIEPSRDSYFLFTWLEQGLPLTFE